ncbi:hypothetical protein DM793_13585 [Paenarthrobacter nitroguajacolicus]|uniref:hypothetical protein n=1 Tax=Paenarthrobacter nitroguajacolicus TaxID=211146 RepID=UPI0015B90D7E|nr:hypothetical protein [Paenarthrobacter nitroguajacolicus]NWL12308.1 hypothetical protein [Paenarthrobacter nitroguajacolicus]
MSIMRKITAAAAGSLFIIGAVAVPSQAARNTTFQDGLVNVNVGDVTILEDVNVAAVVGIAANVCGVNVGPVAAAVLGEATAVDASGRDRTICESAATGEPLTITQN